MVMLDLESPDNDLFTDKNDARSPLGNLAPFKSDQVKKATSVSSLKHLPFLVLPSKCYRHLHHFSH